jgi:DNA polymerase/3'-5' exonuclease PolX
MPSLSAPEVAKLLQEFGQRTALRGGNPYRAKAYTRAAENLLALTEPLEDLVAQDRLKEIPGVGDAIADIIAKLHKGGDTQACRPCGRRFHRTPNNAFALGSLTTSERMGTPGNSSNV